METYIIKIVAALFFGYVIGLERKIRYNDAGPRTHAMVSLGSCIFMIVSIEGFPVGTFDSSRVAASIVTGISFIGAGTIVHNRENIRGLTTAAGIWVMSAIGMCVGAGMIALGGIITAAVIAFQFLSHIEKSAFKKSRYVLELVYIVDDSFELSDAIKFDKTIACKYQRKDDILRCYTTILIFSYKTSVDEISKCLASNPNILSIEFLFGK